MPTIYELNDDANVRTFLDVNSIIVRANGGADRITANNSSVTEANCEIFGGTGNDIVVANNSSNGTARAELFGESGNDILTASNSDGGNADALLDGGSGDDRLTAANVGNAILRGGAGNDRLTAFNFLNFDIENTQLFGGTGDDIYVIDGGENIFEDDDEGEDTVRTSIESYTLGINLENLIGMLAQSQSLSGNELDNYIRGNAGNDSLGGGEGNDLLNGRSGQDYMLGGNGNDVYEIDDQLDIVVELQSQGRDTVRSALATVSIATVDHVENVMGTAATGQRLIGNALDNRLTGRDGADRMSGLAGNDTYVVQLGDRVVETAGQGTDRVYTALRDYTLAANVEELRGTADTGQKLTGNGGNNWIAGSLGADTMAGLKGDDTYVVGSADSVIEKSGEGRDTVQTSLADYRLAANLESLIGLSSGRQTLTGNSLENVINGGTGTDFLNGQGGDDILIGGLGSDMLEGGAGRDVFSFSGIAETSPSRDVIVDFTRLTDLINLSEIDADATIDGNQSFAFIGSESFSSLAGQLRFIRRDLEGTANDKTIVYGDVDGNGNFDFRIDLNGSIQLTSADFVL